MTSKKPPQTFKTEDQPKLDSEFTKQRFQNQVVIVTGGSGGIGSGFVRRFVNDGASVAIVDLDETKGWVLADRWNLQLIHTALLPQ